MTVVSYGQNLEDVLLWRALKDVTDGFYIDIGAADPLIDYVTKLFYENGWHGINVEPTKASYEALVADRARDLNLNVLVAPEAGVITLHEIDGTGLSTIVDDIASGHRDAGFDVRSVTRPAIPLTNVLEAADAPAVHFLKLDIEGAEGA